VLNPTYRFSFQALKQIKIDSLLMEQKGSDENIKFAVTKIISCVVFPAGENKTSKWLMDWAKVT
jgi:hypothetical protein